MPSQDKLHKLLQSVCNEVRCEEKMSLHTSWGIGGNADYFALPSSVKEVSGLIKAAGSVGIPYAIIGSGTNLLVDDDGVAGLIIKLGANYSKIKFEQNRMRIEAGAYVPCAARSACSRGLSGLEHIIGVPGSMGGLITMNGGSQRKSIADSVLEVVAIDDHGDVFHLKKEECGFDYRTSRFQDGVLVVLESLLSLNERDIGSIRRECLRILEERRLKFPLKSKNCGSVFLSTAELYSQFGPPGKVIEKAGLKGLTVGGVKVSEQHANFIVNVSNGTSKDVIELIGLIRKRIYNEIACTLMCEVRYLHRDCQIVPFDMVFPRQG